MLLSKLLTYPTICGSFSLILKDIVMLLSKLLTYPINCRSFIHNGLITSTSLYAIKYLSEFFEPYDSPLECNVLLTSMSSILITFLFLQKSLFLFFCLGNSCSFHSFLYSLKKSKFSLEQGGCIGSDYIFYCRSKLIIFQYNGLIELIKKLLGFFLFQAKSKAGG